LRIGDPAAELAARHSEEVDDDEVGQRLVSSLLLSPRSDFDDLWRGDVAEC
jgi:hypothetical protein